MWSFWEGDATGGDVVVWCGPYPLLINRSGIKCEKHCIVFVDSMVGRTSILAAQMQRPCFLNSCLFEFCRVVFAPLLKRLHYFFIFGCIWLIDWGPSSGSWILRRADGICLLLFRYFGVLWLVLVLLFCFPVCLFVFVYPDFAWLVRPVVSMIP